MGRKITDWDAWFWAKVDKSEVCWLWTGDKLKLGYGKVPPKHEPTWRSRYAHRISYEMLVGPIPDRMVLDHLCRNPSCVKPEHLEAVPARENIRRGVSPVAQTLVSCDELGICKSGHPLQTPEDWIVYRNKAGKLDRGCRECKREYVRRRRARVRSEQCLIEHTPGEPMRLTVKITEAVNA